MAKYNLDCLGEACPIPLMKVQDKIEEMEKGDTLIVSVDHNCAMKNIPNWANDEGYNVEIETVGNGKWDIIINI